MAKTSLGFPFSFSNPKTLALKRKAPRASLEAVVLDMVATGHPINEGELEVAATEDEACLGACAVAPAPQVPQGLEHEADDPNSDKRILNKENPNY